MFKDAKVGDRVWSIQYGWSRIIAINWESPEFVAQMEEGGVSFKFTTGGFILGHDLIMPTVFWDKVHIDPPPRPKRKVKVQVEVWANIYKDPPFNCGEKIHVHESEYRAKACASQGLIACVRLTGSYEVEE